MPIPRKDLKVNPKANEQNAKLEFTQTLKDYLSPKYSQVLIVGTSTFKIVMSVVPGGPIPFQVRFWSLISGIDFGTKCTFKILLEDKVIFTIPDVPYTPNASAAEFDTGTIYGSIDPPPPGSILGQKLYSLIGSENWFYLTLEVTTNGTVKGLIEGSADWLHVTSDYIYPWLWFWDGASPLSRNAVTVSHDWKENYSIGGILTNDGECQWTFDYKLEQIDQDNNSSILFSGQEVVPSQKASPLITFQPIIQSWRWFLEGVWIFVANVSQEFHYQVNFTITDAYGNRYPTMTCPGYQVNVNVSDEKIELAQLAFASQTSAEGLSILSAIPWAGVAFALAAAAAAVAANVYGAYAEDPPEPDFGFKKVIKHSKFSFPSKVYSGDQRLFPIIQFFELQCEIIKYMEELTKIEGRIIGAQIKKNGESLTIQKRSYRQTMRTMLSKASQLTNASDLALKLLSTNKIFQNEELTAYVNGKKRITPKEFNKLLRKGGVSKAAMPFTIKAFEDKEIRRRLFSEEGFSNLFKVMSITLFKNAQSIEQKTDDLLKGYKIK